ncbi:hypothetical protein GUITHDRAFT_103199 [Guillardia theta CCMP2712]|uniref:acid phosphatase n=2 Tax=Guillardia theta TaxID=55529 RepID=L1JS79_GUITC|nr:hypothetical protein GUITHDRAFT_103199 [Guillardia theta CCMP2712]EKX51282.1 hypothetical protein GUITHDRAFT_103199 [Guillardia theta CCMP2712]|eukprot:XP_005838262.1 hypothetical protein GUITHDRAFT_103199 [Guillardia theta CCMP2712]
MLGHGVRVLVGLTVVAASLAVDAPLEYTGRCDEPGETCLITRADNPLPLVELPKYRDNALSFASIGDWGCGPYNCVLKPDPNHISAGATQKAVAGVMAQVAEKTGVQFVLAVGDNFYFHGVQDVNDPLFDSVWRDRFNQPSMNVPWYVTLGNHDHYGNPEAQIDYSKAGFDKRWILPNYYYTTVRDVGSNGKQLQLVFVDTVILDEGYGRTLLLEKIREGIVQPEALARYDSRFHIRQKAASEQLLWLEETLAQSTADWLIVIGHYPVYSGGEHGSTFSLVELVKPLLEKYKVDAYISGHDHNHQHLQHNGVQYYVSGNGCLRGIVKPLPMMEFGAVDPGFMHHQVDGDVMITTWIDMNGRAIYSHTLKQKRNV